jgi:DNA-binding GntR family transcriptional regulator
MEQEVGILHDSISSRVEKWLSERILDDTYPPGHRLVELQIARELKTSQAPVREALRKLAASGLVESEPFKGTRVRRVTNREMREAYQVRAMIEQHAAEMAADFFRDNTAGLQGEMIAAHEAALRGDNERFSHHNASFHRKIVQASGNSILLRIWDGLGAEIRTQLILSKEKFTPLDGEKLHQAILDALHQGNGALAGRLLLEHLLGFVDCIDPTR